MRTTTKKQRLKDYLAGRNWLRIGESEWTELLRELSPISESYLRKLLRATDLPFDQPFAGIRQGSLEELERSLVEMERVLRDSPRRSPYCRSLVIQAKDHARLAARNPKTSAEKRAQKQEMVQWMLVWLENPPVFPAWVQLRKRAAGREPTETQSS